MEEGLTPGMSHWLAEQQKITPLWPYIVSEPDARGERVAYCPLHEDGNPSMSINFGKGVWYCHAGYGGASIRQLLDAVDTWVPKGDHPGLALGGR